jgi:hypothetical protein
MWDVVEEANPGLSRHDVGTWNALKSSGKYGLSLRGPSFHPQLVWNRQNENLVSILRLLIGSPDILVSQDRFTIYRSTVLGGEAVSTGPKNVHLDLNPWWWLESSDEILRGVDTLQYQNEHDFIRENNMVVRSMGTHVQSVLNFSDNLEEDGGTIIVPKFHLELEQWCADNVSLRKPIPWLTMDDSTPLLHRAHRVPMRRGSVLLWNQVMFHGTAPNRSSRCRTAQYLKAFPRSCVSEPRLIRRSQAVMMNLRKYGVPLASITKTGHQVFGLDTLGSESQA